MNRLSPVTPGQFALFRIIFGSYLALHFASQLPHAVELFSRAGVLPDPQLNPLHGLFPNPLALWDSPAFTRISLVYVSLNGGERSWIVEHCNSDIYDRLKAVRRVNIQLIP